MTWVLHIENPKESTKRLLELINKLKLQDIRSMYKNHLYFYKLEMNNLKMKLRKQFHLQ